jgi:hypothetical protein
MAATMGLQREIDSRLGPEEAQKRYVALASESFRKNKWFQINQSPSSATFGREQFHLWQILLAILLFPLGLLALLGEKQHHWVTATFLERDDGTAIALSGAVPGDSQIEAMLDYIERSIDTDASFADLPSSSS